MLDQRQGVARNHLYSFDPAYQTSSSYNTTRDIEFDFQGANKTQYYDKFSDEIEFHVEAHTEEGFGAYSPPLWKTSTSRITDYESSPLLPHKHHYSNLSPGTRSQAITEGRRELMAMIQNMSESSYELSLRDIVDEQHNIQHVKEEIVSEERSFNFDTQAQFKNRTVKKKRKDDKPSQISRSGSMEKETFLIKMFFPSLFGSKKKAAARNNTKISPRPSFEESESHINKEWWFKKTFVAGEKQNSGKSSSIRRISSSNSSTTRSRHADGNSLPACWPFFCSKKNTTSRHGGCVF